MWSVFCGFSLATVWPSAPIKAGSSADWIGLSGVGAEPHPTYGLTIPHSAFMLFQLMFAALIAGAEAI